MKPLILLLCIGAIAACTKHIDQSDVNRHRHVQEKAGLHGVHSELLRNTMQRMNLLIVDGIYTPLQLDEKDQDYLAALAETATDLALSVEILTHYTPIEGMSGEQREIFQNIAEQLYNESENVVIHANNNNILEMDGAFQRLEKTCIKCHLLFREQ